MTYRFGRFQVDDEAFRLSADGETIPLEPKTFRLLLYLVQSPGRLSRKQELLDTVWQAAVTENVLSRSISLIRKALDDDSRDPQFIETVPTAGYRFIAPVEAVASVAPADSGTTVTSAPLPAANVSLDPEPRPAPASLRPFFLRPPTTMVISVLAIAGVISFFVARRRAPPMIHSLAVLPLSNLSGDSTQDYFADGMTDELITELAHIPNLRVVSHTSVMANRNSRKSLPEIARELQVDAVVEGSTVRSGDRVRITAQLIDARTDRHLWAQSFEGPASDILTLQDSVASQIASQARLVLRLAPPRQPVNPDAHDAYLRGRYFLDKQDFAHSIAAYQKAISIDPQYASAYAGYANALEALGAFGHKDVDEVMPQAIAAAQRAIQLDRDNGEAYTDLGSIQTIYTWDWPAAEQNLTRGIALNPEDPVAEFKYATYLDAVGRPQDAVTHMRRAVELDPLSFMMNRRLGATLYLARQYDAAIDQLQRAAEMEDSPATIDNYLSHIYEAKGQRDLAVESDIRAQEGTSLQSDAVAFLKIYRQQGWQSYWRARTQTFLAATPTSCTPYFIGLDDLRVGNLNDAFASFEHAIDQHCINMALLRVDPLLDTARQDPRYTHLLSRVHL